MNILYTILITLFGWLLGILSPGIINKISEPYRKKALQRVIIEELKDIRGRLIYIPLQVHPAYGTLDIKLFEWIKKQTNNFTEHIFDNDERQQYKELCKDKNIKTENVVKAFNLSSQKDNPSFHFKKMEISVIDSNQNNFEILNNEFLAKIFEIKFHIKTFNEEVQSVSEYLKMTFDSNISGNNHQIIKTEIKRKNYIISEKAILIAKKINKIIQFNP